MLIGIVKGGSGRGRASLQKLDQIRTLTDLNVIQELQVVICQENWRTIVSRNMKRK